MFTFFPKPRPLNLNRVVVRLRLVLISMAVTTAAVAIAATLQTRTILDAKQHLNARALPMHINTELFKARVDSLLFIFQRLNEEDNAVLRKADLKEISARAEKIREIFKRFPPDHEIRPLFDTAERLVSTVERAAEDVVTALGNANHSSSLNGLGDNRGPLPATSAAIEPTMKQKQAIADLPVQQSERPSGANLASLFLNQAKDIRTILGILSDRSKTEQPAALTTWIKSLAGGAPQARSEDLERDRRGLLLHLNPIAMDILVSRLDTLTSAIQTKARGDFALASMKLSEAARQLIWVLFGALLTILALVLVTNTGLVERQINRRMKRLGEAVNAISGGDLDHPIKISGSDEIGEMASALVIFKKNAQELRRSNEELEKFAYVAAHDLRSPLRAISDLSTWILEDQTNDLSAESKAYLAMLQSRTDRLNRLLADLLDYARAGHDDPDPQIVNLQSLVSQTGMNLDPEGMFHIRYDGPTQPLSCYLTAVTQTLSNLISNAIKHHDKPNGTIEVHAEVKADRLYLRVQDDGPGIEPKYQDRIFELFQTLRPRDEVEGSGLGLAIVSKLAERYGGAFRLKSDPEKERGASFEVDLPVFPVEHPTDIPKAA